MTRFSTLLQLILFLPSILSSPLRNDNDLLAANGHFATFFSLGENIRNRNLDDSDSIKHIDFTELLDPDYANASDSDPFLGLLSDTLLMLKDYIHTKDDDGNLLINSLMEGLLDEDGFVEFEIAEGYFLDLGTGSAINLTSVGVKGLDTFREADLLQPTTVSIDDGNSTSTNYESSPKTTLQNSFVLDTLVLDLFLTETTNGNRKENLTVRLPFSGVAVSAMPLILAVWEEGLKNFPVGAALTDLLLPCLRDTVVDDSVMLALEATFEEVGVPSLVADSNPDTTSPFFGVVTTLFVGIPASVPIFFNSTVRGLLNDMLQNNLVENDDDKDIQHPCPSYPNEKSLDENQELIDFRAFFDKGLPALLMDLLDEELIAVNPNTGLPKINDVLIVPLMEEMSDQKIVLDESGRTSMLFGSGEDALVDVATNLAIGGLSADVKLRLSDLIIYNLDTMVQPLDLLQPVLEEPQHLNNTMTMGLDLEENTERSMGMSVDVSLLIATDGAYLFWCPKSKTNFKTSCFSHFLLCFLLSRVVDYFHADDGIIEHNLRLNANMEALSIILTALLEVVESKLYGFPVKDIMNLQCWLATLRIPGLNNRTGIRLESESPSAGIAELKASLARMNVNLACLESASEGSNEGYCTSAGMEEWIDLMATPDAQAGMTESMNSVLAYAVSLLSGGGAILQTPIDRILNEASIQCPHNPYYDPDAILPVTYESMDSLLEHEYSYDYLILWGSIAVALIVAFASIAIGVRCNARRKHRRWLVSADFSSEKKMHLSQKQRENDILEEGLNATTDSMFRSGEIPALIRWGMPLIILGNVALFLSGHLNLGATVYIEANIAGDTIKVDDFFDFAIARTTIDLWKAGGKALALLILLFSGIWPYTKQFLTMALWFMPTSRISISTRGIFLIWLDRLAKWSMIDIFVIVVCIAAFRVSVKSPEVTFLPENFYSIDLMVVPMWGLYSNMTAQLVSQISSHLIIYYHRYIVTKATEKLQHRGECEQQAETEQKQDRSKIRLKTHAFSDPYYESTEKLVAKNWVGHFILVSSICMTILVVLGSFVPSFSVELLGIIGVAVESGQGFEEAITHHSVWSIVEMLFEEARFLDTTGDYIGVGVLGSLVLATVMVVPVLQVVFLICQWFIPLAQNGRRRLLVMNEILQAWQYIEVYLIALFVASW